MSAAVEGHKACLEELIKAGADVNKTDLDGNTTLQHASTTGKSQCLSTLIEAGADVNIANKCFARNGDDKSIIELIRAGADVNIVNKLEETAMSIAKAKGHQRCRDTLVQAGAVVNDEDEEYLKIMQLY